MKRERKLMHAAIKSPQRQRSVALIASTTLLALMLAAAVAVAIAPQPAHAASANTKACKAYAKMLSKSTFKWVGTTVSSHSLKFACQDINKDGVKDLIVYNPVAFDYEGFYRIYTFKKGKVKRVGSYYDVRVCRNKNFFESSRAHMDNAEYTYYRLGKDGKAKKLVSYKTQMMQKPSAKIAKIKYINGDVPVYYYACKVNGKSVSYSKCMAKIKSLKKGSKDTLKYRANTAKNRAKYLK